MKPKTQQIRTTRDQNNNRTEHNKQKQHEETASEKMQQP